MNDQSTHQAAEPPSQGTDQTDPPLLAATNLHKHYKLGPQDLHVLRGVDVVLNAGEWVAILGRSGSGKSTLLHLLGGLDRPDEGQVFFNGDNLFKLRGRRLDRYRNRHVGFVFQAYHLMPELTALENVLLGGMIGASLLTWPAKRNAMRRKATALLERVGLKDRMAHRPAKLSGGERQRVAIARALINEPDVLLTDEPTGNLDAETGSSILELFQQLHDQGQTIVTVTHDQRVAEMATRVLTLTQGVVEA